MVERSRQISLLVQMGAIRSCDNEPICPLSKNIKALTFSGLPCQQVRSLLQKMCFTRCCVVVKDLGCSKGRKGIFRWDGRCRRTSRLNGRSSIGQKNLLLLLLTG